MSFDLPGFDLQRFIHDTLAEDLGLHAFAPPVAAEPIQVEQFWHERVHQDEAHRWLRGQIFHLGARST